MRYGIDYESLPVEEVKRLGASFVCRYLSEDPAKNLTPGEAESLSHHGVDIVVVWETTANRALDGGIAGQEDAHRALVQALECGMVGSRPIYFAVDFDSSGDPSAVDSYFDGVAKVLGHHRCGPYGGKATVSRQLDRGFQWAWQTYAWSRGVWDERAQLRQVQNGNQDDHDVAVRPDFGQWRYRVPSWSPVVSPLAVLLPKERREVDQYEELAKHHAHLHPHALETVKARLVLLRKAVWLAAVKGKLVDGKDTEPGWDRDHRGARYELLRGLTK